MPTRSLVLLSFFLLVRHSCTLPRLSPRHPDDGQVNAQRSTEDDPDAYDICGPEPLIEQPSPETVEGYTGDQMTDHDPGIAAR